MGIKKPITSQLSALVLPTRFELISMVPETIILSVELRELAPKPPKGGLDWRKYIELPTKTPPLGVGGLYVETEVHYIAIFHNIGFTLYA